MTTELPEAPPERFQVPKDLKEGGTEIIQLMTSQVYMYLEDIWKGDWWSKEQNGKKGRAHV